MPHNADCDRPDVTKQAEFLVAVLLIASALFALRFCYHFVDLGQEGIGLEHFRQRARRARQTRSSDSIHRERVKRANDANSVHSS